MRVEEESLLKIIGSPSQHNGSPEYQLDAQECKADEGSDGGSSPAKLLRPPNSVAQAAAALPRAHVDATIFVQEEKTPTACIDPRKILAMPARKEILRVTDNRMSSVTQKSPRKEDALLEQELGSKESAVAELSYEKLEGAEGSPCASCCFSSEEAGYYVNHADGENKSSHNTEQRGLQTQQQQQQQLMQESQGILAQAMIQDSQQATQQHPLGDQMHSEEHQLRPTQQDQDAEEHQQPRTQHDKEPGEPQNEVLQRHKEQEEWWQQNEWRKEQAHQQVHKERTKERHQGRELRAVEQLEHEQEGWKSQSECTRQQQWEGMQQWEQYKRQEELQPEQEQHEQGQPTQKTRDNQQLQCQNQQAELLYQDRVLEKELQELPTPHQQKRVKQHKEQQDQPLGKPPKQEPLMQQIQMQQNQQQKMSSLTEEDQQQQKKLQDEHTQQQEQQQQEQHHQHQQHQKERRHSAQQQERQVQKTCPEGKEHRRFGERQQHLHGVLSKEQQQGPMQHQKLQHFEQRQAKQNQQAYCISNEEQQHEFMRQQSDQSSEQCYPLQQEQQRQQQVHCMAEETRQYECSQHQKRHHFVRHKEPEQHEVQEQTMQQQQQHQQQQVELFLREQQQHESSLHRNQDTSTLEQQQQQIQRQRQQQQLLLQRTSRFISSAEIQRAKLPVIEPGEFCGLDGHFGDASSGEARDEFGGSPGALPSMGIAGSVSPGMLMVSRSSTTSDLQLQTETLQLLPSGSGQDNMPAVGPLTVATALATADGRLGEEGEFLTPMEAAERAAEFALAAEMAARRATELEDGQQPDTAEGNLRCLRADLVQSSPLCLMPEASADDSSSLQFFLSNRRTLNRKRRSGDAAGGAAAPSTTAAAGLLPRALALPSGSCAPLIEEGQENKDSAKAAAQYYSVCAIQAAGLAVAGCMQSLQGCPSVLVQTRLAEQLQQLLQNEAPGLAPLPQGLPGSNRTQKDAGGNGEKASEAEGGLQAEASQADVPPLCQSSTTSSVSKSRHQHSLQHPQQGKQFQKEALDGSAQKQRELNEQARELQKQQRISEELQRTAMEQKLHAQQELQQALLQQQEAQQLLALMRQREEDLSQQREQLEMQQEVQRRLQQELHMRGVHQRQQEVLQQQMQQQQQMRHHQQRQQLQHEEMLAQMKQQLLEQQLLSHQQVVADFEKKAADQLRQRELLQQQLHLQLEDLRLRDQQQKRQEEELRQRQHQLEQLENQLTLREKQIQQQQDEHQAREHQLQQQQQKAEEEHLQKKVRLEQIEKEISQKAANVSAAAAAAAAAIDSPDGSQPVFSFVTSLASKGEDTIHEMQQLEQNLVNLCLGYLQQRKRHLALLRKPLETEGKLLRLAAADPQAPGHVAATAARPAAGVAIPRAAPADVSGTFDASSEGQCRLVASKLKAWNAAARCVRFALLALTRRANYLAGPGARGASPGDTSQEALARPAVASVAPVAIGKWFLPSQPQPCVTLDPIQQMSHSSSGPATTAAGFPELTLQTTNCQGLNTAATPAVAPSAPPEGLADQPWQVRASESAAEAVSGGPAVATSQILHQQQSGRSNRVEESSTVGYGRASTVTDGPPERLRSSPSEVFRRLPSGLNVGDLSVLGFTGTAVAETPAGFLDGPLGEASHGHSGVPKVVPTPAFSSNPPFQLATLNGVRTPQGQMIPMLTPRKVPPLPVGSLARRGEAAATAAAATVAAAGREWGTPRLQLQRRQQVSPLRPSQGLPYRS